MIEHGSNCTGKHAIKQPKRLHDFGRVLKPVFSFWLIYKYRYKLREPLPFEPFLKAVKLLY